jgi:hypothetical protein
MRDKVVETVVRSWSVENNQAGRSPNRAFFGVSEIGSRRTNKIQTWENVFSLRVVRVNPAILLLNDALKHRWGCCVLRTHTEICLFVMALIACKRKKEAGSTKRSGTQHK